jgi:hypothetical protein
MAETAAETPAQTKKSPPKKPAAPPPPRAAAQKPTHNIFESMARIQKEDWGTRASVYAYRAEPMIDRTRTGDAKYIQQYAGPVTEDRLMEDHGSGRYKLMLNFKKPGADQGDEVDSGFVEILNMKFPPKIPEGHWVDDPKNIKWAWAKQYFQKERPGGDSVEMLRVLNEVQNDAIERARPHGDSPLDTIRLFKEMSPPASTENKVLDSIVTLMSKQLDASHTEAAALRARSDDLMMKLIELKTTPAPAPQGLGMVKEIFSELKGLMPMVTDILPHATEVATRSRMSGWQEFLQPVMPSLINGVPVIIGGIVELVKSRANAQPNAAPPQTQHTITPGAPAAQGAAPGAAPTTPNGKPNLVDFLNLITPPMVRYLDADWSGNEFAEWLYDGYGDEWHGLKWMEAAKTAGQFAIIAGYRQSPFWDKTGGKDEVKFTEFVRSFLSWVPEKDEEPEPAAPLDNVTVEAEPEVIELG